jgi:hypothetical protein
MVRYIAPYIPVDYFREASAADFPKTAFDEWAERWIIPATVTQSAKQAVQYEQSV